MFLGQNFWQTGGLKKKREAMRSPKSREVFNSRRENHMYVLGESKTVLEAKYFEQADQWVPASQFAVQYI